LIAHLVVLEIAIEIEVERNLAITIIVKIDAAAQFLPTRNFLLGVNL
jgi:hypothetical protein